MADITSLDLLNQTQIELLQKYDGALNRFNEINNYFEDGKAIEAINTDLVRGLPADFTSSKNTNGYQKLPSGIIIQWGYTTVSDVIFPIAFPNAVLNASMTKGRVDGSMPDNSGNSWIGAVTKTGMKVGTWDQTTGVTTYQGILWIAIGY